jgi:hypothetical protein
VVPLGLTLRAERARPLFERAVGELTRDGKRFRASTLFEPKVGGGGHLLLVDEDAGTTWARVLVEPDGAALTLVAAIFDGNWEPTDDALATRVRDWLGAIHGVSFSTIDADANGSTHAEPPPHA